MEAIYEILPYTIACALGLLAPAYLEAGMYGSDDLKQLIKKRRPIQWIFFSVGWFIALPSGLGLKRWELILVGLLLMLFLSYNFKKQPFLHVVKGLKK